MNDIQVYIQIGITTLCTIAYYWTYKYQAEKLSALSNMIETMNNLIKGQSNIISDFEKYKSLFDIADFEKRLNLKLDNKEMEMNKMFQEQVEMIKKNVENAFKIAITEENKALRQKHHELSIIAIQAMISEYPTKADKKIRDESIKALYPHNTEDFIGFIDHVLDKEVDSQ